MGVLLGIKSVSTRRAAAPIPFDIVKSWGERPLFLPFFMLSIFFEQTNKQKQALPQRGARTGKKGLVHATCNQVITHLLAFRQFWRTSVEQPDRPPRYVRNGILLYPEQAAAMVLILNVAAPMLKESYYEGYDILRRYRTVLNVAPYEWDKLPVYRLENQYLPDPRTGPLVITGGTKGIWLSQSYMLTYERGIRFCAKSGVLPADIRKTLADHADFLYEEATRLRSQTKAEKLRLVISDRRGALEKRMKQLTDVPWPKSGVPETGPMRFGRKDYTTGFYMTSAKARIYAEVMRTLLENAPDINTVPQHRDKVLRMIDDVESCTWLFPDAKKRAPRSDRGVPRGPYKRQLLSDPEKRAKALEEGSEQGVYEEDLTED